MSVSSLISLAMETDNEEQITEYVHNTPDRSSSTRMILLSWSPFLEAARNISPDKLQKVANACVRDGGEDTAWIYVYTSDEDFSYEIAGALLRGTSSREIAALLRYESSCKERNRMTETSRGVQRLSTLLHPDV